MWIVCLQLHVFILVWHLCLLKPWWGILDVHNECPFSQSKWHPEQLHNYYDIIMKVTYSFITYSLAYSWVRAIGVEFCFVTMLDQCKFDLPTVLHGRCICLFFSNGLLMSFLVGLTALTSKDMRTFMEPIIHRANEVRKRWKNPASCPRIVVS